MVSLVILMVGLVGLLQSTNMVLEHNYKNQLRDEAVQVAEREMNNLLAINDSTQVDALIQATPSKLVTSQIRGGLARSLRVTRSSIATAVNSKEIDVRVRWVYKNTSTTQLLSSLKTY